MAKHISHPGALKFENSNGEPIKNWAEWKEVYRRNPGHFVPGRSAYSVAQFVWDQDGGEYLRGRVSQLLPEHAVFHRAVPELEVRFDDLGKGRFHDLGIYGSMQKSGKSIFVSVEAKVDEPFGDRVKKSYLKAVTKRLSGQKTNAPERIERLLFQHFPNPSAAMWNIRYQLLYATAGTLAVGSDRSVLYIIVFRTPSYDEEIGRANERDYLDFMRLAGATDLGIDGPAHAHRMLLDDKELLCVYEYFDFR